MDRMIFVAMTGAKQLMNREAVVAQNLANVSTTGYRAAEGAFRAVPVVGEGMATRSFVVDSTVGANFASGPLQRTGRDLDVAVHGPGWIAVQTADGEAYTRDGGLQISPNGVLQIRGGQSVLGDGGPLSIPPDSNISIAGDGTLSATSSSSPNSVNVIGRIKLVNPDQRSLVRGGDGLFRLANGSQAPVDPEIRLTAGALEGSNVNLVEAMITMISVARQFDLQMQLLSNAQKNEAQASRILNIQG